MSKNIKDHRASFIESIKRIYRNSESSIIPFAGGISLTLLIQLSKNNIPFTIAFFVFIVLIIIAIYNIRKSNLEDDIIDTFVKICIARIVPYETKLKETDNYYFIVLESKNFINMLFDKYMEVKNLNLKFSEERKIFLKELIMKKIISIIKPKLEEISEQFKFIKPHFNEDFFTVLRAGKIDDPKNSLYLETDIKQSNCFFATFENKKGNFYDININYISYVEYKGDKVVIHIAEPNQKQKSIIVSKREWFANRNISSAGLK